MPDGTTPDPRESATPNPATTARPGDGSATSTSAPGDGSSTSEFIRTTLAGRDPYGTSGLDFANTLAGVGAGQPVDPRLAPYFTWANQGSEGSNLVFTPTGDVSNQGTVTIDGVQYIQLGGATDNTSIKDRSLVQYDPKWGLLTPATNVSSGSDPFSDIAPILAMGAFAGPAVGAAIGAGAGAGALDGIDTAAIPAVTSPALPELAATPEIVAPGAAAGGGGAAALAADGLDTSLIPSVTAPELPALAPTPDLAAPGLDTSLIPSVTSPDLPDLAALPDFAGPSAGSMSLADSLSGTPLDGTQPFNVPMQPAPDIAPPDFTTNDPGLLQSAWDQIKGHPFQAAGLGLSAVSQVLANKRAKDAASQLKAAGQPLSDEASSLFAQYGKGQLNPADEFRINQWEQAQIAKAQGLYAGNSTAGQNAVAQIQAQAEAMRSTALEGLLKAGIQASGMALGPLTQAIELQGKEDSQFAAAQANALRALMLLGTGSTGDPTKGGGTP